MEWTVELVIAIIGAITGVSGLLLQFFDYWKTRPNISFEVQSSYFIRNPHPKIKTLQLYDNVEIFTVFQINLRNQSINPITIEKIEIYHKESDYPFPITNDIVSNEISYYTEKNSYRLIKLGSTLQFPHRLESYDTYAGNIKVSWFSSELLDSKNKLELTLSIFTSKNKINKKVTLEEFDIEKLKN